MIDSQERILSNGAQFKDLCAIFCSRKLEDNCGYDNFGLFWGESKSQFLLLAGAQSA